MKNQSLWLKSPTLGGPGEGAFFNKRLLPANLTRSKAHSHETSAVKYCNIMVRDPQKVKMHLMFGFLALFADQLLKLVT